MGGSTNSAASPDARTTGGFSLVELVVTIAVLGILAGVAGPKFFRRQSFDERITRDQLAGSLRYAQKLALATGCEVEMQITGNSWGLHQRASCTTGAFTRDVVDPADGDPQFQLSAAGAVAVASSANPIVFDQRGRSVDGSAVPQTVTLTAGSQAVQVVGTTGYVRLP